MDEFLHYYNEELRYLKQQGQYFAEKHPNVAGRLKLSPDSIEDPFVGQLTESFAFLTARLQQQLDSEYAGLSDSLIDALYPHFRLPVPSMTVTQFAVDNKLTDSVIVARDTPLLAYLPDEQYCRFNTCYATTLRPIDLSDIVYSNQTISNIRSKIINAKSSLQFQLKTLNNTINLQATNLDELQFYVDVADEAAGLLYQQLTRHCLGIVVNSKDNSKESILLDPSQLTPMGFANHEAVLPEHANSSSAYRLMMEYFCLPQKFMFFKLSNLQSLGNLLAHNELQFTLIFDTHHSELAQFIGSTSLKLHCTPVINLFEQEAEPIKVDFKRADYQIIVDQQQAQENHEIYQVQSINAAYEYGEDVDCLPMLGSSYQINTNKPQIYWQEKRVPSWQLGLNKLAGDEVMLSINASDAILHTLPTAILRPKVLCTNRELPNYLPYTGGHVNFQFMQGEHQAITHIRSMTNLTRPVYRHLQHSRFDLINHLQMNQVGFSHQADNVKQLIRLLSFYQNLSVDKSHNLDEGVISFNSKTIIDRLPSGLKIGLCQGLDYQLCIDEEKLGISNPVLFSNILQHMLARFASINSFVKLSLSSIQRGEIVSWPVLIGNQAMI